MNDHLVTPPSLALLGIEPVRALFEYVRHYLSSGDHAEGDGHAIVLFPGLGADERLMTPLARHCERLGYECFDWGRGRNAGPDGDAAAWIGELGDEIDALTAHNDNGVTLIGWSLGGFYAREIAKARPHRIRQVITLGCPFAQVGDSTNVGWLFELLNGGSATVPAGYARELRAPPPVPTTSIYSRSDGVVAWQACRVKPGPIAENVEVESSHLGLVWHPEVLRVIADRLAQPRGHWRPWEASETKREDAWAEGAAA